MWTRAVPEPGDLSPWDGHPAAESGRVFFETPTGVVALDARNGTVAWTSTLWARRSPGAFNIAARAPLLYLNEVDSMFALSMTDGRRVWAASVGVSINYGHVLPVGDAVLTTTARPSVAALDASTGQLRWEALPPAGWDSGGVFTGLGASGDTVYVAANQHLLRNGAEKRGSIIALDRASGRILWTFVAEGRRSSAGRRITVAGRALLVADLYGNSVFALDRFTGRESWRVPGAPGSFGPDDGPLARGDTAFVGSNDQYAYAFDIASGAVIWRKHTGGSVRAFTLCGPFLLANNLALSVVPRDPRRAPFMMLSNEDGPSGFPTSGFVVVDDVAVFATSRALVAVRCV